MDMSVDSRPGEGHNEVVELNVHTEDKGPKNPHGTRRFPIPPLLPANCRSEVVERV